MRTNATTQAKHRLNQKRRLEQAAVQEVRSGIKMPDVVALNLKAGLVGTTAFENGGNVFEGIAENSVVATGEVRSLPVVLEVLVALKHLIKTEVHRTHVE